MSIPATQDGAGETALGRWLMPVAPVGWRLISGYGLRSTMNTVNPSSLLFTEDALPGGDRLDPYVQAQIRLVAQTYPQMQIAGPAAGHVAEADEAEMLILKHDTSNAGTVYQIQTYARCARWIGIITLTTTERDLPMGRAALNEVLAGLRILPDPSAAAAT